MEDRGRPGDKEKRGRRLRPVVKNQSPDLVLESCRVEESGPARARQKSCCTQKKLVSELTRTRNNKDCLLMAYTRHIKNCDCRSVANIFA